ncbi:MAG: pyruvate:ferredoxin (flavodoxin) oxidoreductase [Oscillospiraceae bacterium]|nr:pyruvate:ferredoxin (flavodoxin) oxidoreductase [Oscillospiraceae bacterium]MDD3833286.1 pyruvate:ferredoxin (flavodoxin) oxidoreductase [Oscillospiraceae bacterium]
MARKFKTMDGNNAAAHVSYAFTDVAAIYPITPSSVMAEETDKWAANGQENLFGRPVKVAEMQSEAGAAGAVHGSLAAGALTTTYTASQGLLLMIPNMYKIAGELLPNVIHVSARAIASHALSIFGDHSDIYACRQTGYAMLCSSSVQEVMDLGAVAHLSTLEGRVPFLHFFDGFRTSHEIQKIKAWDYKDLGEMLNWEAVDRFRSNALNPEHPVQRGTAQNPDIFFQSREASNSYYNAIPKIVESYMNNVNKRIGSDYKLFNYYGPRDAKHVIIAMGSVCETIEETVDHMNAAGAKVGLIKVRLYRPFSVEHLLAAIPKGVESISVLDRTKEPGSIGEPLYLDVCAALKGSKFESVPVYTGRYGLGSKDTTPGQIISVYNNTEAARPKKRFTIGIEDDVTRLSLKVKDNPDTTPRGTRSCKFWGLGSDGTVGANKNSIKIIGDHTDMYAQGYFSYDSKKSGGVTISHLRFGKKPIKSTYFVNKADFVACHNPSYIDKYDMISDVKPGGIFLLNCSWNSEEMEARLPAAMKRTIVKNNISFYTIDATHLAKGLGLGNRTNTILQAAFFKLAKVIPVEDSVKYMKDAATKSYSKKGEAIVKMNHNAIDTGVKEVKKVKIPEAWAKAKDVDAVKQAIGGRPEIRDFIDNVLTPVNAQQGDKLPVSTFLKDADGTVPLGSSAYEKRGIAVDVPEWQPENCIQCNFCSYVCPHAVIRPVVMNEEEAANAPEGMKMKPATGLPGYQFAIAVSTLDCTGCGSCSVVCPGMKGNKALVMKPIDTQLQGQKSFFYGYELPEKPEVNEKFKTTTVKGSQFIQPLLEFSGACAGCGEPPYAKLATQLFGDRMFIANATGCTSIWGGSSPSTPYTVNKRGHGPAWANSLFEDNAEYGYGMLLGITARRNRLADLMKKFADSDIPAEWGLKEAAQEWLDGKDDASASKAAAVKVVPALEKAILECGNCGCDFDSLYKEAIKASDLLVKKSFWMFGGDGWAYDIGFGGLDHVIAAGEDVNILVFDTEVYSNTGGQASKSTPTGSVAQFAAAGKSVKKKDLGAIAMSYGYVYVAQIAMGADMNQTIKALVEAESYPGPSIIIAYSPCINHGIKGGMGISQLEEKKAVEAGYWYNYRFDPRKEEPFTLDSKKPSASYRDFIMGEVRYNSLLRTFPERAEELFAKAESDSAKRYDHLLRLGALYGKQD